MIEVKTCFGTGLGL